MVYGTCYFVAELHGVKVKECVREEHQRRLRRILFWNPRYLIAIYWRNQENGDTPIWQVECSRLSHAADRIHRTLVFSPLPLMEILNDFILFHF